MAAETNEIITNDKTEITVAEPVQSDIRSLIYVVRGQQVMLDSDLAMLYQVETAIQVSIRIMKTFVEMRKYLANSQ